MAKYEIKSDLKLVLKANSKIQLIEMRGAPEIFIAFETASDLTSVEFTELQNRFSFCTITKVG